MHVTFQKLDTLSKAKNYYLLQLLLLNISEIFHSLEYSEAYQWARCTDFKNKKVSKSVSTNLPISSLKHLKPVSTLETTKPWTQANVKAVRQLNYYHALAKYVIFSLVSWILQGAKGETYEDYVSVKVDLIWWLIIKLCYESIDLLTEWLVF